MDAQDLIRIPAAGTAGTNGSGPGDYPYRPVEAQFASAGLHGQSAAAPSAGSAAQNINVRLGYMDTEPAVVQVAGEGVWTGKIWKVNRDRNLFLDCKGGDGGRGGIGQDGQIGGRGSNGRDATKYRQAENGGMGGKGGDGGYGTDGANGGDAGNVFITVGEDDLDLLVACTWDTSGGKGGPSGTHGMPGDGGIGGAGGNGCTWTERRGDVVHHKSNPPGAPGHPGPPGGQPSTYLSGGNSGRQGSTQIRVLNQDNTEATYPGRYELEVVSFEVYDEGGDGINEPGEHLIVKNIKIRNKGQMPSPGPANPINILIHGTNWLQPVAAEPVEIPHSIPVGGEIFVPGTIRALIRNETDVRESGKPLDATDEITLIGTFYKRLNRSLVGFSGSTSFKIGYPLELSAPKCLDCVQKGDRVRFSWTLRNVSTKEYGINGIRYTASRFSDPGRIFELPYSEEGKDKHEAIDVLEDIQPGDEIPIEQDFIVSLSADEYTNAELHVELLLADPQVKETDGSAKIRSVMNHQIKMQVAGVYQYDALSRYLLVVNAQTPNWVIHQIMHFVRKELRLGLDIFNLSISGSYIDKATQSSVLSKYAGKSILIFGNTFSYFQNGSRSPYQLLDAWEVCSLAKSGTGFSFLGVDNVANLQKWALHLTYSAETINKESEASEYLDDLLQRFLNEDQTHRTSDIIQQKFKTKQPTLDKIFSCCMSTPPDAHAKKAAKKLSKALPLRRFLVVPATDSSEPPTPNIALIEGLSKAATIVGSGVAPIPSEDSVLADYHKYAIVSALPFHDLAKLFWNVWGSSELDAQSAICFPVTALYKEMGWQETQGHPWQGAVLQVKIIQLICLAIESKIGTELSSFLHAKSSSKNMLKQLPLLSEFLNLPQGAGQLQDLKEKDLVVGTLSTILGSLLNIGLGQWLSHNLIPRARKRKLRDEVSCQISVSLGHVCTPALSTELFRSIGTEAQATKKEIKSCGSEKNLNGALLKRMTTLTSVDKPFVDLVALNPVSTAVTVSALQGIRDEHNGRANVRDVDAKHAITVLERHVNPNLDEDE